MIDTPYFDSSASGTTHHQVAAATAGTHQARIRHRGAGRGSVSTYKTAGTQTATVAAALIPPHSATATADRAAARPRRPPWAASTSGMSIHGSIAAGRNSDDSSPISVSAAGEAA